VLVGLGVVGNGPCFALLKWLQTGYLQGVARRSMDGAFTVPVAVVPWINLMARPLPYCAAWSAPATAAPRLQKHGP
jgi:membrane protein